MLNALVLLIGLLSPLNGSAPASPDAAMGTEVRLASSSVAESASTLKQDAAITRMSDFNTLNDISLSDRRKDVLGKKGKPDKITKDPLTGYTEYHYKDVTVGLYEDQVYYVHLGANVKEMKVNRQWVAIQSTSLNRVLGPADYIAEDGDVYTRGYSAIKIFRNHEGKVQGIDLFDSTSD